MRLADRMGQGLALENIFLDDLIPNEMFLNNAFDHFRRGGAIPNAVGVDQDNRAFHADAQAVSFGAEDAARPIGLGLIESEFTQSLFEVFPSGESGFLATANRLARIGANEDMAIDLGQSQFLGAIGERGRDEWRSLRHGNVGSIDEVAFDWLAFDWLAFGSYPFADPPGSVNSAKGIERELGIRQIITSFYRALTIAAISSGIDSSSARMLNIKILPAYPIH
jgi:hypothetical protein